LRIGQNATQSDIGIPRCMKNRLCERKVDGCKRRISRAVAAVISLSLSPLATSFRYHPLQIARDRQQTSRVLPTRQMYRYIPLPTLCRLQMISSVIYLAPRARIACIYLLVFPETRSFISTCQIWSSKTRRRWVKDLLANYSS
jgi:hypothetical protein